MSFWSVAETEHLKQAINMKNTTQSKKQSFLESMSSTGIGFIVSLVSTFIVFPMVGIESNFKVNLQVTLYFTIISILRGYLVRRFFNKKLNN